MYKKCGRHDVKVESLNNEEQLGSQFFNFMTKHPKLVISQVCVPQINLEVSTAMPQVVLAPSSVGSALNNQKYHVDDINEPTPCALLYFKGRTSGIIKVADAIVMATHIMHGRPVLSECAVVEVTTIREGHEFEDLDSPDEEDGTEKMKDAKGNFILRPPKHLIIKIVPHGLFHHRAERMRVLQLLKLPYAGLLYLLLHMKILKKLPLLLKI
jgi:hypothetical protein